MDTAVYDMMVLPELPTMESISSISLKNAGKSLLATSVDGTTWLCNNTDISGSQQLTKLVDTLSTLTLDRCENFKPSQDGLALWGMEVPGVIVEVYFDEDQLLTLQIGNQTLDGSGYYVRVNDDTTIYSIDTHSLEPIITAAPQGFVSDPAASAAAASSAQN